MDISEVLDKANITSDSKARRVLNTAPDKIANITLSEIEQGVTIERLEALTVPVYQYGTQITIHGIFKDMPVDSLRVLGYKSVFLNQNKSLGVKYVAIDGAKKQVLLNMSRFSKTKWHINIDSEGLKAHRIFWSRPDNPYDDKQACIDCYKSTPDNLYIGGKQACALMYGGYAVILNIGAIYEANLWQLITWLTGIESQAEFDSLKQAYDLEQECKAKEYEAQRKIEQEAKQAQLANAKANFKVPSNWLPFKGKIESIGTYARIYDTWESGIALQVFKVVKRGAFLCCHVKNFKDFNYVDWQTTDKSHKCERTIDGWQIVDKPVKPLSVTENKAIPQVSNGNGITISHNEKLNGIEVKFANKPDNTVIDTLKSLGLRWSYQNMLWYSKYNPELMTKIQNELIGDKELCNVL